MWNMSNVIRLCQDRVFMPDMDSESKGRISWKKQLSVMAYRLILRAKPHLSHYLQSN